MKRQAEMKKYIIEDPERVKLKQNRSVAEIAQIFLQKKWVKGGGGKGRLTHVD